MKRSLQKVFTWDEAVIVQPRWHHGLNVFLLWVHSNTCCRAYTHTHTGRETELPEILDAALSGHRICQTSLQLSPACIKLNKHLTVEVC